MARNVVVTILLRAKDEASGVMKMVTAQSRRLASSVGGAFRGVQNAMGSLGVQLTLGAIIGFVVKANAEFERFRAQLRVFTGSAVGAVGVMRDLRQAAIDLPFDLAQITKAYVMLRAAGVDPSIDTLTRFSDIASAMGRDISDFAVAVKSALAGEMEPMKQFGFTFRSEGGKIKASFADTTKTIENNAGAIIGFLDEIAQNNFAGASAERMKTMEGAFSNLMDAAWNLAVSVGDAGVRGQISGLLLTLTDMTNSVRANQEGIHRWTTIIIESAKVVVKTFTGIVSGFFNFGKSIGFALKGIIESAFGIVFSIAAKAEQKVAGLLDAVGFDSLANTLRADAARTNAIASNFFNGAKTSAEDVYDSLQNIGLAILNTGDAYVQAYKNITEGTGFAAGPTGKGKGMAGTTTAVNRPVFAGGGGGKSDVDLLQEEVKGLVQLSRLRALTAAETDQLTKAEAALTKIRDDESRKAADRGQAADALEDVRVARFRVDVLMDEASALTELGEAGRISSSQLDRMLTVATGLQKLLEDGLLDPKEAARVAKFLDELADHIDYDDSGKPIYVPQGGARRERSMLPPGGNTPGFGDMVRSGIQGMTADTKSFSDTLADLTANGIADFVDAFVSGFDDIREGWAGVGDAMKLGILGALSAVAAGMAKFYIAKAVAAIGEGIAGDFRQFAAAGKFTAAASLFGALSGLIGGSGGGRGGGGGITASIGKVNDRERDETVVVLNGSNLLNLNDPRTQDEFREMLEKLSGRRVVIRGAQ